MGDRLQVTGMELRPKDSEGHAIEVGDAVIVRGSVIAIITPPSAEMPAVLQIKWETPAPLLDFVQSTAVTKEATK